MLEYNVAAGTVNPDTGKTYGTSGSASLTIENTANNVSLENITVANTFDYPNETIEGKMAVAMLTRADKLIFNNVRLTGGQVHCRQMAATVSISEIVILKEM